MSKERELLKRWLAGEANQIPTHVPLLIETQNLLAQPEALAPEREFIRLWYENIELWKVHAKEPLAQPEQTEQEPVAWMYDHHIEVGHDKYTEFNVVETCARNLEFESCINVRPLYLTPPKREQKPLTRQQISEGNQSMLNVTRDAFVNGVKWAEKAHGIGEN